MAYPIEYLNLYDKEGNLVNEKGIRGVPSNYLKGIVIIYIENSKGEFLIQKTSKARGSVFATTGGHVDYGDTFDSTIIKEVKEELGLDISNDLVKEVTSFTYDTDIQKVYYLKKDIDIKDITIKEDEVEYVKWMSIDEIKELIDKNEYREGNIDGFNYILKHRKD
jgi:8-oxo-dGTP pyrophosphatase MutT (NUDIX family)